MRSIVKITHKFNNATIEGECNDPISLLSNKNGSYFSISNNQTSYQGLMVFRSNSMYKLLDAINFSGETTEIINSPEKLIIKKNKSTQEYYFDKELVCEITNYTEDIFLDLDFRYLYDSPDFGRIYEVKLVKDNIFIIKYSKYSDTLLNDLEEVFFMAIFVEGLDKTSIKIRNNWISKQYSIDNKRGYCATRHVNDIFNFKLKQGNGKLIFSYGKTQNECLEKLGHFSISHSVLRENKDYDCLIETKYAKEISALTYSLDMNIHHLMLKDKYPVKQIFAGWPWFFQFWTRDSLISLGALITMNKFVTVKKILEQYLTLEDNKGLINSRIPSSTLKAIDSTGWLFKRYYDFIYSLSEKKQLDNFYTSSDLQSLKLKLEKIFDDFIRNNMKNGLIYSDRNETWMDTNNEDSGRTGYCIEIQALTLSMIKTLRLLSVLSTKPLVSRHLVVEKKLILNVRKRFLKDGRIADRVTDYDVDFVQRPNIFIARYVYSHLFSDKEWKIAFDKALDKLWLDWGGLTSIDKFNHDFIDMHAGSNNKSYHRGDSWYFLNNIVATQLYFVDKTYFAEKIDSILKASLKDLFFSGMIGGCSELSSAREQTGEGCLNQSWSSSTLLELIYLLSEKNSFLG